MEQVKTNFDNWRDNLTIDDFVNLTSFAKWCSLCSASEDCDNDKFCGVSCKDVLRQWAEKEYIESN